VAIDLLVCGYSNFLKVTNYAFFKRNLILNIEILPNFSIYTSIPFSSEAWHLKMEMWLLRHTSSHKCGYRRAHVGHRCLRAWRHLWTTHPNKFSFNKSFFKNDRILCIFTALKNVGKIAWYIFHVSKLIFHTRLSARKCWISPTPETLTFGRQETTNRARFSLTVYEFVFICKCFIFVLWFYSKSLYILQY